jgi:hypothetical protein
MIKNDRCGGKDCLQSHSLYVSTVTNNWFNQGKLHWWEGSLTESREKTRGIIPPSMLCATEHITVLQRHGCTWGHHFLQWWICTMQKIEKTAFISFPDQGPKYWWHLWSFSVILIKLAEFFSHVGRGFEPFIVWPGTFLRRNININIRPQILMTLLLQYI